MRPATNAVSRIPDHCLNQGPLPLLPPPPAASPVAFFQAVPLLLTAGGLMVLSVFVYAIIGTQLFKNVYHYACVDPNGVVEPGDDADEFGCGWRVCPANYTCTVRAKRQHQRPCK